MKKRHTNLLVRVLMGLLVAWISLMLLLLLLLVGRVALWGSVRVPGTGSTLQRMSKHCISVFSCAYAISLCAHYCPRPFCVRSLNRMHRCVMTCQPVPFKDEEEAETH